MRIPLIIICALLLAFLSSCDLRSGTAKKEMERWETTPEPVAPKPADPPIDPADVVQVDTSQEGDTITLNISGETKPAECAKFNSLFVNGKQNVITIKGVCRQIMINGDGNQVTADAAMEFVFNGSDNIIKYSRIVNGKRPIVKENQTGNAVEKVSAPSSADDRRQRANRK